MLCQFKKVKYRVSVIKVSLLIEFLVGITLIERDFFPDTLYKCKRKR